MKKTNKALHARIKKVAKSSTDGLLNAAKSSTKLGERAINWFKKR